MKTYPLANPWLGLALLAAALVFASCQPPTRVPPPEEVPRQNLMDRAASAMERDEFDLASELYWRALQEKDLGRKTELRAWRNLARSALKSGKPVRARESLKRWRMLNPDAAQTWAWQEIKSGLIRRELGQKAYVSHLQGLMSSRRPWALNLRAGRALTELYTERERPRKALSALKRLDELAGEDEKRGDVVDLARGVASSMPHEARSELLEEAPRKEAARFPVLVFRWEQALYRFQQGETGWKEAWKALSGVLKDAEAYLRSRLEERLRELEQEHGRPAPGIVLLLPLSGGYGDIGWGIVRGADAAQWRMSQQGRAIRLRVINTQERDWLERLSKLSATYSLAGGPIRASIWEEIHEAGLHEDLAFFTFRSSLSPGTEGEDAYRFFPGRTDQVRALLDISRKELDLDSFGTLYPRSSFGRSMARSFWNATVQKGAELNGLGFYDQQHIAMYEDKVADYLHVPEGFHEQEEKEDPARNATNATQNATRIPEQDFDAVFIPGSFSRARILIPEFFYFNQPDLVFLGPALWSQEIKRISGLDMRYYNLTIMASPWWPDNPARQMKVLRHTLEQSVQEPPDFWVGLGYDFLRFAMEVAPAAMGSSDSDLTGWLHRMSGFDWTLAPFSWDEQGRASQDLYVLRPVADGVERVRPEKLRDRLEKARKMKRKWLERTRGNATKAETNETEPFGGNKPEGEADGTYSGEGGVYDDQ